MREILFRAQTIENNQWVEGYFVYVPCGRFLCEEWLIQTIKEDGRIGQLHTVYESTVGQFTGLTDKNGKKIFEGDIVDSLDIFGHWDGTGIVNWNETFSGWHMGKSSMYCDRIATYEVIGNIHDNPVMVERCRQ